MSEVQVRVDASGHADAAASAPEEWESVAKKALSYSVRLTVFVDKQAFLKHMRNLRIPDDVAIAVAETARITSDDAYFRDR